MSNEPIHAFNKLIEKHGKDYVFDMMLGGASRIVLPPVNWDVETLKKLKELIKNSEFNTSPEKELKRRGYMK